MLLTPRIKLEIDVPRSEMRKEGWAIARTGGNIWPAVLQTGTPSKYVRTGLPEQLFQEPNTGVIMLRPHCMYQGFEEDPQYDFEKFSLSELDMGTADDGTDLFLQLAGTSGAQRGNKRMLARWHNQTVAFNPLSVSGYLLTVLGQANNNKLAWAWATKTALAINEGFGCNLSPAGTNLDRADPYACFSFSEYYYLQINLNGTADFWENVGTTGSPQWLKRKVINFGDQGIDHNRPFQVMVLPFGKKYLWIQFSQRQTYTSFLSAGPSRDSFRHTDYLFDIEAHGRATTYDAATTSWVKTKAAKLHFGMRLKDNHYDHRPFRIRFPTLFTGPVDLITMPEQIGYKRNVAPTFTAFGYYPTDPSGFGGLSSIVASVIGNQDGTPYVAANHTAPVVRLRFSGTGLTGLYTPELWWYEGEVAAEQWLPPYTAIDVSTEWSMIRFQRTTALNASTFEVKTRDDGLYAKLYKKGSPTRLTIDGAIALDCYGAKPHRTGGGITKEVGDKGWLEGETEGFDMWMRVNNTPIMDTKALDGGFLGPTIKTLLQRCAWQASKIIIVDPELNSLEIESFTSNNSLKTFNSDSKCGDVIRELCRKFGIQGRSKVRVRPDPPNQGWRISLAPAFIPGTTPDPKLIFFIDSSVIPQNLTDRQRWDGSASGGFRYFRIKTDLEFVLQWPEFNLLKVVGSTSTQGDAEGIHAIIEPHPDLMNNPASQIFEGILRPHTVGPPEITAETENDMQRQGRMYYDQAFMDNLTLGIGAEWQKEVDADQFCLVVGRSRTTGLPCSYGVFRIDVIDCQIERDLPQGGLEFDPYSQTWSGDYTLCYQGPSSSGVYPMFTDFLPPATH